MSRGIEMCILDGVNVPSFIRPGTNPLWGPRS